MLTFQILDGGTTFYQPLEGRALTIGSQAGADIRLTAPGVSAIHARVEPVLDPAAGGAGRGNGAAITYKIVDLDSAAGTRVNGEAIAQVRLALGDRIEVGQAVLILGQRVMRTATPEDVLEQNRVTGGNSPAGPRRRGDSGGRHERHAVHRRIAVGSAVLAAVFALGTVTWWSLQHVSPPLYFSEVTQLRKVGDFDGARAVVARLEREWARGNVERMALLTQMEETIAATEQAVLQLQSRARSEAAGQNRIGLVVWLKEQETGGPAQQEAARILQANLDPLAAEVSQLPSVARADGSRAGTESMAEAPVVGDDSESRREGGGAPAEGSAGAKATAVLAAVDELVARQQLGAALERLQRALTEVTLADAAVLRERLEQVRDRTKAATAELIDQAHNLVALGKVGEAVALLEQQASRFPASGELSGVAVELSRLRGLSVASGGAAGANAATSPDGRTPGGGMPPSSGVAPASLPALSALRDQAQLAASAGDFAGAQQALQRAAEAVAASDAKLAAALRSQAEDMGRVTELVTTVARKLGQRKGPELTLEGGEVVRVVAVADGRLEVQPKGGSVRALEWTELSGAALASIANALDLPPAALLGAAVLAYQHGAVDEAEQLLVRAVQREPQLETELTGLVARGRGEPPDPQGYKVVGGQLVSVSRAELAQLSKRFEARLEQALRRGEAERGKVLEELVAQGPSVLDAVLDALRRQHAKIERRIGSHGIRRAWQELHAARQKLDEARLYALELIFDEQRYFYPFKPPAVEPGRAAEYARVQEEVDRRVDQVRRLWNDNRKVRVPDELLREAERLRWITRVLADFGERVPTTERAAWVATLPDGEPLTLQTFAATPEERDQKAHWRRIMALNEKIGSNLSDAERRLLLLTNEYRLMMGRGPMALSLRILEAARGHSTEMATLGYFGHFSPRPERRTPADRLRLAGYDFGATENCAMCGSPEQAHQGWTHSSGHHRNLLDASHTEFAPGNAGNYWTENFGSGKTYLDDPRFEDR